MLKQLKIQFKTFIPKKLNAAQCAVRNPQNHYFNYGYQVGNLNTPHIFLGLELNFNKPLNISQFMFVGHSNYIFFKVYSIRIIINLRLAITKLEEG